MKIIRIESNVNGARPPLQDWGNPELPSGFAWCPNEFAEIFYSTSPSGFVNIEVIDDRVVAMTVNEDALAKYVDEHPEPTEPTESEPTTDEILDALLGVSE